MDEDWRERGEEEDLCIVMREKRDVKLGGTVEKKDYI
jgi:hypothetical protein